MFDLANDLKDEEMVDEIYSAEILHKNFFHNDLEKDAFDHNRFKVEKLIKTLSKLLFEKRKKVAFKTNSG